MIVTFDVAKTIASGKTLITFGNEPAPASISDAAANALSTVYLDGVINVSGFDAEDDNRFREIYKVSAGNNRHVFDRHTLFKFVAGITLVGILPQCRSSF